MFDDLFLPQSFEEEGEFMPLISIEEEDEDRIDEVFPDIMPILALKNTVLFPGIVIPITVGRDRSIKAINKAYENDRTIAVLSQKDTKVETPVANDLYRVGTIAKIVKILKMPDGTTTAILQGRKRFSLVDLLQTEPLLEGIVEPLG